MWTVQHHRPYLWGRKFVLITDCSTLMWLFKSQALSSKLHRWVLRLMEYEIDQAGELSFVEYKRLTTGRADYRITPTVSRGVAAAILVDFALPPMAREARPGLWPKRRLANGTKGG